MNMIPSPDNLIDTFADFSMKFSEEDTLMYWSLFLLFSIPLSIYTLVWLVFGLLAIVVYLPFGLVIHTVRHVFEKRNSRP